MLLLANENIPLKSINILRHAGHNVVSIGEETPGFSDSEILRRVIGGQIYV